MGLRRAVLFASSGRYLVMVINLVSTVAIARLLTPAEFGISVLGTAALGLAEAVRDMGFAAYLVQQKELTQEKIRTVFTVSLMITLLMAVVLVIVGIPLSKIYGVAGLVQYMQIAALGYVIAPFAHPIYSLLSRDLAFGSLAALDVLTALAGAFSAIGLLLLGFSYMSMAWMGVIATVTWTTIGLFLRRDFIIYRPCLKEWRSVIAFGACGSATAVLNRATDSLFYLMLGKALNTRAAGVYQRAVLLAKFPDRVILSGIGAVALPAFSLHARHGRSLKSAYLNAVEHVTAIQWPALLLLCLFGHPIVSLVLGPRWLDVVPLTQIIALASVFNFAANLNYAIQVAAGAIRQTVLLALLQMAVVLIVLTMTSHYGVDAVALGSLVTVPIVVGVSMYLVRRRIAFTWWELVGALGKSLLPAMFSVIGPLVILIGCDFRTDLSIGTMGVAVSLSGIGWVVGLRFGRHPLFQEICLARDSVVGWVSATLGFARLRPCGNRRSAQ
jgi:O-antigen/teichoic acid export membrane protein